MAEPLRAVAEGVGQGAGLAAQGWAEGRQGRTDGEAGGVTPASVSGHGASRSPADASAPLVSLAFHEASGRWMAVYTDPSTGQVLKTLPPEELLDAVGRVRQGLGLFLDTYR